MVISNIWRMPSFQILGYISSLLTSHNQCSWTIIVKYHYEPRVLRSVSRPSFTTVFAVKCTCLLQRPNEVPHSWSRLYGACEIFCFQIFFQGWKSQYVFRWSEFDLQFVKFFVLEFIPHILKKWEWSVRLYQQISCVIILFSTKQWNFRFSQMRRSQCVD